MKKQFLTDYLISTDKRFEKGSLNLIISYAGSGKSSFITGEKGLIYNTKQFYNDGMYKYLNFSQQKHRILYVTDNLMNRDLLIINEDCQKFNYKDFYSAKSINGLDDIINNKTGTINVITYAKLISLLTINSTSKILSECIDLIILDEIHNLFNYSLKFDKDEDKTGYFTVINNLNMLSQKCLTIGLTATPKKIYEYIKQYPTDINFKPILTKEDLENIISYTEENTKKYLFVENAITDICNNKIKDKVLIYVQKITTCKSYKERLIKSGYNVEYLCADNKLDAKQQELKQYLIKNETLPKDLDILIINEAYETGWNLKDDSVQIVIINSSDETTITQARNRVRHNIQTLITKVDTNISCKEVIYDKDYVMKFNINEDCLNKELTSEEFNRIKEQFGTIRLKQRNTGEFYGYCSKKDFINIDLAENGYLYKDKMIIKKEYESFIKDEFKDYLQNLVGNRLYKKQQQELIVKIGLKDNQNRLQKKISTLNGYLIDNYNMMLISKRVKEQGKLVTVWIINNI